MDFAQIIQAITVNAIPLLLAITLHEAAHGYAALKFGDDTAQRLGRISLNPIKHIDPVGTVVMPLLLFAASSGAFSIGYAKPVPVNFNRLRNPKLDMVWVALAGPGSNLLQAIAWLALLYVGQASGIDEKFFGLVCAAGVKWNLILMIFNLLPLPPLDGGRVLVGLLPRGPAETVARVEPFGFFIVIALVFTGVLSEYWLAPLMGLSMQLLQLLLSPLEALLF
ncbi:MAG: site-2 protease family protein [Hydrogenophaga sp.]